MTPAYAGHQLRIMPVGDSITAGYTDNPTWSVPFNYGWRGVLYQQLQAVYPGSFTYVGASGEPENMSWGDPYSNPFSSTYLRDLGQENHRGYGGQGTGFVLANIAAWMAADRPDVVLLMVGINDIPGGSSSEPTTTEANLSAIVKTIYDVRPDTYVIVAQIFSSATDTPAIGLYNTYIRDTLVPAFRANGKAIATVDQYAALLNGAPSVDASFFANGINHPKAEGYTRMATAWYSEIEKLVT